MTLPFALGCPSCRHYEQVSTVDPDASLSELYGHVLNKHTGWDRDAALTLAGQARELTQAEAVKR